MSSVVLLLYIHLLGNVLTNIRNKNIKDEKNDTWPMQALDDAALDGEDNNSDTGNTSTLNAH